MRILISIFLFTVLQSFSQHEEPYKPLTPFADISFEEGMVVYIINQKNIMMNPGLLPRVIDNRLLRLKFGHVFHNVSGKYIDESIQSIRYYIGTELITVRSTEEQNDYLKLCSVLIIWDNQLSNHAQNELEKLITSSDKNIRENAKLVARLFEFYNNL